jgi:4-hydroxybenzoate polyprenyltransferase/phosphoserine phosphatase
MTDSPLLPLCIDLDGTLIRTDSLVESALELLRQRPFAALLMPFWLVKGKAGFKSEIATRVELAPATLPYRESLLTWLREQARVRPVYLATAAHRSVAEAIARYLGCFTGVIATHSVNLSAHNKAAALVEQFGECQFDYAGNSRADLPVWQKARHAIVVGAPASFLHRVREKRNVEHEFDTQSRGGPSALRSLVRALRLHQWVKNLLVFLVPLAAHRILDEQVLASSVLAFVAFGLASSGTYVINDLFDLSADRAHPRKRLRPFAAGDVPLLAGIITGPLLLALAIAIGLTVSLGFVSVLGVYMVSTALYSTWLKRMLFVDVIMLASFYALRVVAGAAATQIELSFWLLSVCAYGFLSLALLKRYAELLEMDGEGRDLAPGRGYLSADRTVVLALGIGTGLVCSLVVALYIDSAVGHERYARPEFLWMLVVLTIMGIGRLWLVAGRGEMHDDPILFVARDPASLALLAAGVGSVLLAA